MARSIWFGAIVGLALLPGIVVGQRKMKKEEDFLQDKPRIGERIPDLIVYDSRGNEINTAKLRGHYTVLTFGCLT